MSAQERCAGARHRKAARAGHRRAPKCRSAREVPEFWRNSPGSPRRCAPRATLSAAVRRAKASPAAPYRQRAGARGSCRFPGYPSVREGRSAGDRAQEGGLPHPAFAQKACPGVRRGIERQAPNQIDSVPPETCITYGKPRILGCFVGICWCVGQFHVPPPVLTGSGSKGRSAERNLSAVMAPHVVEITMMCVDRARQSR